jgi:RNA polymerase sigma factor (sigma-70 family)
MSALFRGSSTATFDRLYERHATSVYRYAYAVLGNHADAEDVTQTTFLNAYRSLASGTKPRKAENWLLTIAHNQIRQHFRSAQSRPREVELDERLPHPDQERSEPGVADVLRALQHLPPTQRAAIVMREFEGRSYAEMAEVLGVTQSALEALLFRARRSLAEQLEGALTCGEAEQALSRKLDGRLPRSEARRLKAHLRECTACSRFDGLQRKQRTALNGLGAIPVPASILLFRSETAAAAAGLGAGAAAAGGSTAVGAGAAGGVAAGVAAKVAAATTAAAVVTGGVGLGVAKATDPAAKEERKVSHAAAVDATRSGGRAAAVHAARALGARPGPALPSSARAKEATVKPVARVAASKARMTNPNANANASVTGNGRANGNSANANADAANAQRRGAERKAEATTAKTSKAKASTQRAARTNAPPVARPDTPKRSRPVHVKPVRVQPAPVARGRTDGPLPAAGTKPKPQSQAQAPAQPVQAATAVGEHAGPKK